MNNCRTVTVDGCYSTDFAYQQAKLHHVRIEKAGKYMKKAKTTHTRTHTFAKNTWEHTHTDAITYRAKNAHVSWQLLTD